MPRKQQRYRLLSFSAIKKGVPVWLLAGIGLLVFPEKAFSHEPDSLLTVKNSPFFTGLRSIKGYLPPIQTAANCIALPESKQLQAKGQILIKTPKHLYLYFAGTGWLYQLKQEKDSVLLFRRIDNTENINYNIDAVVFANGENLYNLGGYGFWKSNGTLRKFNFTDHEWDVEPVDTEVHPPVNPFVSWFHAGSSTLVVPYEQALNSGVKQDENPIPITNKTYRLDLQTHNWEVLGEPSSKFKDITAVTHAGRLTTDNGYLVPFNGRVYWVDFINNQILVFDNSSLAQTLLRVDSRYLHYYYQQKLYLLNTQNWRYDSVSINPKDYVATGHPVWNTSTNYLTLSLVTLLPALALLLTWYLLWRRKSPAPKTDQAAKKYLVNFTETELSLINLLLERSRDNRTASISDINYVLGIRDKNTGMQKKVRSDIINSCNEKYSYLSQQDGPLIQSIRSETDKRYFEYLISKERAREAEKFLS
ncbi:MAG: hypothetical protein IM584_11615 [Chitinophagaceae bacterium]|nr:hypothetical protein [Chitinophagaceae bacterium]MEA3425664.1 hypothetical protein [Bacteroidota bacterium]MCA6453529.1 hypothetical protein [Chitinophagaceae bacterium]MCA6456770.1 hypothetical protein [Chitinophagaceae bacterium]MCA6458988.1 hypothetical protein [Chitinophagaceae bacterium]